MPDGWSISARASRDRRASVEICSPRSECATIETYVIDRLAPRDLDRVGFADGGNTMVVASWLSPRTRELLRARGINYLDLTGNVDVSLRSPAVVWRTMGADRDPKPLPRSGPSLRGPKAWALLRTLIEVAPPYTAGDLARALDVDDGYVSRALRVLADDRLVERRSRGPVTDVDWEATLRRLVRSYSLVGSNHTSTWIATAGAGQLLADLTRRRRAGRWIVTGSVVAASIAPVATLEMAVIYTTDMERLAEAGRLVLAQTGANVILVDPYDPIVFARSGSIDGTSIVSTAQAAADLLSGPGRMPQEGEALVRWMHANVERWQVPGLD